MITAATIETLAPQMDRNARELAHSNMPDGHGQTDRDAEAFAVLYVQAMAETCGALAADQVSTGTWDPSDWLPADLEAVREAAALVGVELDRADWRRLFGWYASPSVGAFDVCGLRRPLGRWIVEGREALGAWGWECVVAGGGKIRDAAYDTRQEAEDARDALVSQSWDRESLRVREAVVMA